jgi:hypothetical protein
VLRFWDNAVPISGQKNAVIPNGCEGPLSRSLRHARNVRSVIHSAMKNYPHLNPLPQGEEVAKRQVRENI